MKKTHFIFIALCFIVIVSLFIFWISTRHDHESESTSPEKKESIADVKLLLSSKNIDISQIRSSLSKDSLDIYLPFSFSPVLFNQMSIIENYFFQIVIPKNLWPYIEKEQTNVKIPQKELIYRSNNRLALQTSIPLKQGVPKEHILYIIKNEQTPFKLLFVDNQNKTVASFDNISISLE